MTEERDFEAEAKEQGWNPNYDGPNATDAKTFVEKGEKITGLLKARVDRQEKQIEELRNANKEFGEFTKAQQQKMKQENERLLTELEARRATAITEGDGDTFTRTDKEIRSLEANMNNVPPPQDNGLDPLAQLWLEDNPWYNTNQKLQTYADGLSDRVIAEGYRYGSKGYFSELTRRVKEGFPEDFETQRGGANTVEQGNTIDTKSSNNAKTFENLPKEAKDAALKFEKTGLMSREDYVKAYEWE